MPPKRTLTPTDIVYLKRTFATKQDLTRFATKDDLEKFATKDQLESIRHELLNRLDKILKEIMNYRDEQTVASYKAEDHEDRISSLENIVTPATN